MPPLTEIPSVRLTEITLKTSLMWFHYSKAVNVESLDGTRSFQLQPCPPPHVRALYNFNNKYCLLLQ